jgi:deoxyribodipyrimidine photo-lyase
VNRQRVTADRDTSESTCGTDADSVEVEPPEPCVPPALDLTDEGRSCVVWHRRNLRLADHLAVARATRTSDVVCPLFVFDPHFYREGLACDTRVRFLHECLSDLRRQYDRHDTPLVFAHGDPFSILGRFLDAGWDVLATADPTGRYGLCRDERLSERGVEFVADDGIKREGKSRENWADHAETYLSGSTHTPETSRFGDHGVESDITLDAIESTYDVSPAKSRVPRGGREAALDRLEAFVSDLSSYPGSISAPAKAESGTSRLSPYLRFGCLSVRECFQYVDDHAADGRARELFVSRLYWNRHYTQKLEDWPGWMDHAVNPVFRGFNRSRHDPDLVAAWKRGETGFPMVDASMRCLRETGWLNFRMRAMCASFFSDILHQPWKLGADFFYYHLVDADPAINYTQWQQQAGVTGVNTMRVYNPRKQVRDNDSDGAFIHEWVPELRPVPPEHLDRPEKIPLHLQAEFGVDIGSDYPYPIVDYEARRAETTERLNALKDRAHEALSDPEIRQRASLSQRGRRERSTQDDTGGEDQTSLSEFS